MSCNFVKPPISSEESSVHENGGSPPANSPSISEIEEAVDALARLVGALEGWQHGFYDEQIAALRAQVADHRTQLSAPKNWWAGEQIRHLIRCGTFDEVLRERYGLNSRVGS